MKFTSEHECWPNHFWLRVAASESPHYLGGDGDSLARRVQHYHDLDELAVVGVSCQASGQA